MTTDPSSEGARPFCCPKCGFEFSVWTAARITPNTKLQCKQCGTLLKPIQRYGWILFPAFAIVIGGVGQGILWQYGTSLGMLRCLILYFACCSILFPLFMVIAKRYIDLFIIEK